MKAFFGRFFVFIIIIVFALSVYTFKKSKDAAVGKEIATEDATTQAQTQTKTTNTKQDTREAAKTQEQSTPTPSPTQQPIVNTPEPTKTPTEATAPIFKEAINYYTGISGEVNYDKGRNLFLKSADKGNALSKMWMAVIYLDGDRTTKKNQKLAKQLGNESIDEVKNMVKKGDIDAMFLYGAAMNKGLGITKDEMQSLEWFKRAAEKGNPFAMKALGDIWISKNSKQGLEWYTKSADNGYIDAILQIGKIYMNGLFGVPKNNAKAIEWFRKGVDAGDAEAMNMVASLYFLTDKQAGTTEHQSEIKNLYEQSADKGYAGSMVAIGSMYATGQGVEKDDERAQEWLEKFSQTEEGRIIAAQNKLKEEKARKDAEKLKASQPQTKNESKNNFVFKNEDVEQNDVNPDGVEGYVLLNKQDSTDTENQNEYSKYQDAIKSYLKSAEQGDPKAMYELGRLHLEGIKVPQDNKMAFVWLNKAAEKNEPFAMYYLGWMYENGLGTSKNMDKAIALYKKSADKNVQKAMFRLGFCYANGKGVEKNGVKAEEWYNKAAKMGEKE